MSELKQKFIDILFEKDAPDAEDDSIESNEKETKKEHSTLKAADIIYRKGSKSPFINLNEDKKISAKKLLINEKEEYKATPKLSPIFGLINDGGKIDENKLPTEVEPVKTTGKISHLDIVPSPIYGYGTKEDYFKSDYMAMGTSFTEDTNEEPMLNEDLPDDNYSQEEDDSIDLFDDFGDLL